MKNFASELAGEIANSLLHFAAIAFLVSMAVYSGNAVNNIFNGIFL
jgi:hypothetical protein